MGHATPLGQPRSVNKTWRWTPFLGIRSRNGQMTLKVKVIDPRFQYQPRTSQDAYLLQIWWFYVKSITTYRVDKPNFLEFWVEMAQITLKVKVNDPYVQYQPRVSQDACLVQITRFYRKSVTSYRADKVKFTYRWTDASNNNTPSAWKAKG